MHDDAKLIVVFCSPSRDLPELLHEIRSRSGGLPLIGCTTGGEIASAGPSDASVVVAAFGGPGFAIETAVATQASHDLRTAGELVARCVPDRPDLPHKVLLLLSDGLAGDQQEMVRGAYSVLGAAVPLVGGCAGDDLKMTTTFQLYGDRVLTDAVVAAGIASPAPLGIGVHHGWRRVGEPMLVTGSAGNRVYTLDDRPAVDVYLEHLGVGQPAGSDQEWLARLALTHPLGLRRASEEDHVRFITGGDFAERSLSCVAEVPNGALVWIMEGDAESVLEATDAACRGSLAALDGQPPLGMIAFDCIARRGVLGPAGIRAEVDRISAIASGAPVAGFYTYGEIARTRGLHGFHNQTLVVLAVA
ncbi:FIST signal transduction protein [Jiangella endophytica]|uniref:FIST signal transduction protein n=1 Tax=Jiangella endophytica TaxID=1623398 RepID=UPI0018E5935F|nr:FIST N-terminal domain-containing protein [Jiangella endophytica]